jgi:hypothetical protein
MGLTTAAAVSDAANRSRPARPAMPVCTVTDDPWRRCQRPNGGRGGPAAARGCAKRGRGVASILQLLTLRAGLQPRARKPPRRDRAEARSSRQMIETRRGRPLNRPSGLVPSALSRDSHQRVGRC